LSAEEIQQRLDGLPDFESKIKSGYLARYPQQIIMVKILIAALVKVLHLGVDYC
jgi:hypothetical protein